MSKMLMREQTFRNPRPELLVALQESGPAGDANGVRGKVDSAKKKGRGNKNVCYVSYVPRI